MVELTGPRTWRSNHRQQWAWGGGVRGTESIGSKQEGTLVEEFANAQAVRHKPQAMLSQQCFAPRPQRVTLKL